MFFMLVYAKVIRSLKKLAERRFIIDRKLVSRRKFGKMTEEESVWNSAIGWGMVWLWVLVLSGFVWLAVEVLLLVWLFRKLLSDK